MSKTKTNGRKTPTIGKAEALQILESAVSYCRLAGLDVRAGNIEGRRLALTIGGARLAHDPQRFEPLESEALPIAI